MEEINKSIGERIKKIREEKDITQEQLGKILGYSPMGISHFERGIREIKFSDLQKVASFFGKSLFYFLGPEQTIFRIDNPSEDPGIQESLQAFEDFLKKNKK